jgi:hypothetical protein
LVKKIDTLVKDIESVLSNGIENIPDGVFERFSTSLANVVKSKLIREEYLPTLRMSNIGQPCNRKLWYTINKAEDQEELRPDARLKFLFGDILEELLLLLAELAGHKVEGRQDEQEIEGIKGHRDAVVDGVVVDVKSASTYSFKKFESGKLEENDPFGYIDQLQSYLESSQKDEIVTDKTRAGFLVVDKTLGSLCLDLHNKLDFPYNDLYKFKKDLVARDTPPPRNYESEPEGKSGNMKLGTVCSYCNFKKTCWPNMRTFLYSSGPKYLVQVSREPDVPEVK